MLKRLHRVAEERNVLPSTIRYYISEGLVTASGRTKGGYYLFSPEDEALLDTVFKLKEQRLTIKEIRAAIRGGAGNGGHE